MTRIRELLIELDNYELAFFAKFKLPSYMKETQSEIKKYIAERGLNNAQIEKLISANPKRETKNGKVRCPRCSSDKISMEKVEWTKNAGQIGYENEIASLDGLSVKTTYKNQGICNVCGNWIEAPNFEKKKTPFWHHIATNILDIFVR